VGEVLIRHDEEAPVSTVITPFDRSTRTHRRNRLAERRRLRRQDALSARLAELHAIRALLGRASDVVDGGWVQGAWFTVDTPGGRRPVTAYDLGLVEQRPVTGACLVGAVVAAAGGPATVRSQLVQRTLDLAWHALREGPDRPVRWCFGPRMRMMQVLELTYWNDAPDRTQGDVARLLVAAQRCTDVQRDLCHAEQRALAGAGGSADRER
jgi:hypothetical protein